MNVLSIENLEKTVDSKALFSNVTLGLEEGEKVGIVGKNGAGKSTFVRVVAGLVHPDAGKVSMHSQSNLVMLGQSVDFRPGTTIGAYLYQSGNRKTELLQQYRQALESGDIRTQQNLQPVLDHEELWDLDNIYKSYLTKFGMNYPLDKSMDSLSGGELKKTAIARVFALSPSIILMDEPTNHLDIRTIELLEDELRSSRAAVIIVTHDRYILNSVCTTIWELDRGHFYRHPGSFQAYLERRAERIMMMQKEQDRLASILRRELVWLARGPQARTGKDKNRKERIDEMLSRVSNVQDVRQTGFSSLSRRLGKTILELDSVTKSYGGKRLFGPFTYSFCRNDKIGIVGDNGCGKSTFLDIVAGLTEPDGGSITRGVNTYISYFDQLGRGLDESKSAIEFLEDISSRVVFCGNEISSERLLELFGFSREKMRVSISAYSGGEKRRLYLISRLVENPNFLILDEPTNDLDLETMENLEEYISGFQGCVLIVSHDRAFLNCTCTSLFVFEDGNLTRVPASYADWKASRPSARQEDAKPASQRPRREHRGLSFSEKREYEALEDEIGELEKEKARLEASFASSLETEDGTLQERSVKYSALCNLIEEKTERYFVLAQKAEE